MKRRGDLLWFVGIFLLFFGFVGSANASSYLWNGIDNGTFYVQNQNTASSFFGLYSWENKNNSMTLFSSGDTNLNRTMDVYSDTEFAVDSTKLVRVDRKYEAQTETLVLGSAPQFGFYFGDEAGIYNTYALSGDKSSGWDLSYGDMTVHINGDVTPSATPLPGAALLFGSSLLGLLGINRRKNKA